MEVEGWGKLSRICNPERADEDVLTKLENPFLGQRLPQHESERLRPKLKDCLIQSGLRQFKDANRGMGTATREGANPYWVGLGIAH